MSVRIRQDESAAEQSPQRTGAAPAHLRSSRGAATRASLLAMQRSAGNRATADLVGQSRSPVHGVVAQPGRPLQPALQREMEQALGHDFSSVRIHSDARAADSARSVDAAAYTVGENIVLGQGTTITGASGRRLLAHELTHVVQQRRGPVDGTPAPGGILVSDPSDRFEREADRVSKSRAIR
jgi:hypothetical protein